MNTIHSEIKAVVFDVFGTLVQIKAKTRPFLKLLEHATKAGIPTEFLLPEKVMSQNVSLRQLAQQTGLTLSNESLVSLELELENEIKSIEVYHDVDSVLVELKKRGYQIGLCSNLAAPYGPPVKELLPMALDAYTWSYEAGAIKPSRAIYLNVCEQLNSAPENVMFVGDTFVADYVGPTTNGMHARHLIRNAKQESATSITTLSSILRLL